MPKRWGLVLILLRLCAAAIGLSLLMPGCFGVGSMVRKYGYTEIQPPSNLLQPGALVYVRDDSPFVAGIICTPAASLGPAFVPRTSRTAETEAQKLNGATMAMGASSLAGMQGDARLEGVEAIEARLTNAKILEVDDSAVVEHLAARSAACTLAAARREAGKFDVTMISSALVGDVVYTVRWRSQAQVSAKAEAAAMGALEAQLGGVRAGGSRIWARGLVWGVRDDRYLAGLSIPGVDEREIPKGKRVLAAPSKPPAAQLERPHDAAMAPSSEADLPPE